MKFTRKSPVSGIEATLELSVTQEMINAWNSGVLIQDAMPNLTPDQREFLMTGILPDEWDSLFEEEEG